MTWNFRVDADDLIIEASPVRVLLAHPGTTIHALAADVIPTGLGDHAAADFDHNYTLTVADGVPTFTAHARAINDAHRVAHLQRQLGQIYLRHIPQLATLRWENEPYLSNLNATNRAAATKSTVKWVLHNMIAANEIIRDRDAYGLTIAAKRAAVQAFARIFTRANLPTGGAEDVHLQSHAHWIWGESAKNDDVLALWAGAIGEGHDIKTSIFDSEGAVKSGAITTAKNSLNIKADGDTFTAAVIPSHFTCDDPSRGDP